MSRHLVEIYGGALDENPEVKEFESFYEAQDFIYDKATEELGIDYSEEDFEQFMTLVKIKEVV